MLHKQNCRDVIVHFEQLYTLFAPDEDSVTVARELWQEWEKTGNTPPAINEIARDYAKHENGFFYELVKVAEKMEHADLNIHCCQFPMDHYNAYAFSAKDGYIILVDVIFLQILFFLCNILVFDAMGAITDPEERAQAKQFVAEIIHVNYFKRQRVDFSQQSIHHRLLGRNYELTEFSNYVFHSLKAFIIAHEIGHHVLKHTRGVTTRIFAANGNSVAVEVDERAIACEFEADSYGYKLFDVLSNTNDDSVYYAWCKYKFNFAPVFLFDLFGYLDRMQEQVKHETVLCHAHPPPAERIKALQVQYPIDDKEPLYVALKESLEYYLGNV